MTPLDSHDDSLELPLLKFQESPRACSYLPEETASLEYEYLLNLPAERYQTLLEQGWRRFGRVVFRPRCPTCRGCRSLRIDVARFTASKSQRRCLSRNADVTLSVRRASATAEHVDLFNAYHHEMHLRKGWPPNSLTRAEYAAEFADPAVDFAWETLYHRDGRLIGVGLVDVLPGGLSSVYFYHAPEWRPLGPGTFSVLRELALARELRLPYLYLGYWIERCPSMTYKNRFEPHELLEGGVEPGGVPVWRPARSGPLRPSGLTNPEIPDV